MKKILAILVMLVALLASCDDNVVSQNGSYHICVDTIKGHEYLVLTGSYFGHIIHSESCQCKKGGDDAQ